MPRKSLGLVNVRPGDKGLEDRQASGVPAGISFRLQAFGLLYIVFCVEQAEALMVGLCFPRTNPGPASFSLEVSPPADRTSLCGLCWVGWLTLSPAPAFSSFCPSSLPLLEDGASWAVPWGELRCGHAGANISLQRGPVPSGHGQPLGGPCGRHCWEAWVGRCPVGKQEGPWPSAGSSAQIDGCCA